MANANLAEIENRNLKIDLEAAAGAGGATGFVLRAGDAGDVRAPPNSRPCLPSRAWAKPSIAGLR
jgi:hypothetical protein